MKRIRAWGINSPSGDEIEFWAFWRDAMYEENKQLGKRWFEEVWNQGRVGAIDELLSPEAVGFGGDRHRDSRA